MTSLTSAKCINHPQREAVAKCLGCNHFFCRECVVEHEGKMVCQECLSALTKKNDPSSRNWSILYLVLFFASGFFLWLLFYCFGGLVLEMPDAFHDSSEAIKQTESQSNSKNNP